MSGTDVYSIFSVTADHYSSVYSPRFGNTVEENASNSFVRYGSLAIFRKAHKSPSFDMCKLILDFDAIMFVSANNCRHALQADSCLVGPIVVVLHHWHDQDAIMLVPNWCHSIFANANVDPIDINSELRAYEINAFPTVATDYGSNVWIFRPDDDTTSIFVPV